MPWPLSQDYNEAIQSPASCFTDPELQQAEARCNAIGLPMPCSGNFADVYQMHGPNGKSWAVKCFTRQVPGLRERYAAISACLKQANLPFMVDFTYLDPGIQVRGQWYPVLKMDWVEGFTLNEFVKQNADQPATLDALCQIWVRLARRLREAKLAHADLQHGNVLLVPGTKASSLAIKLIDYDGMWVPALAQSKSGEVGHPAYQHPQRLREGTYNAGVDAFSHLVIYAALRALSVRSRYLWNKYDNGDNLLFKQADLEAPSRSALFQELQQVNDPELQKLTARLAQAAQLPVQQTPLLDELVTTAIRRKAVPVPAIPIPDAVFASAVAGGTALLSRQIPSRQRKSHGLAWAIGVGGGMAALAVVLLVLFNRGPATTKPEPVAAVGTANPPILPSTKSGPAAQPGPDPYPKSDPKTVPSSEPKVEPQPNPETDPKPDRRGLAAWGQVVDPNGDCTITENDGKLTIKVPGTLHDLNPGETDPKKRNTAPRVLREVQGDFVLTVKVTADWKPGNKLPSATTQPYNGAGLLVWGSNLDFVRLERNVWVSPKGRFSYRTPIYCVQGRPSNQFRSGRDEFFKGRSTWLKVERTGEKITTSISHDGKEWTETAVLTTKFPESVRVGVEAINSSDKEFVVEFEEFKIASKS
jgi:hypothetical protein